jgi:tetratricopeptide (TPR) repeat protein
VRRTNPASAQAALSVARDCHQVPSGEAALSQTVNALARGDYSNALALAERVEPSTPDDSGWLEYDRGQALTGLRRTSEALLAFDKAEQLFTAVDDQRGRSDAAWGKARALELAGLCPEADRAYASYERIVGSSDPASAQMAAEHARACSPTIVIH